MLQGADVKILLYRARLLVEEGRYDAAQEVLESIQPVDEKTQQDVTYLLGWCYVQRKEWEEGVRILTPLIEDKSTCLGVKTPQEREQHALALLLLGLAAVNMAAYEDASLHFTRCLKVLHDRRVHLPVVRIHARYYLAMTCLMRGLYTPAIQYYEEALQMCHHYHDEHALPDIYHGLCEAYRRTGDLLKATIAGKEALRLYEDEQDQQMVARMHNLLGRACFLLCDYREASDHYTESLAIATSFNGPTMAMLNCAALAEVRMAEERLDEALRYCHLALSMMKRTSDVHMQGRVYHVIGKVTHREAHRASGFRRQQLLEEAASWYEKANVCLQRTQAYGDMTELCGSWAQILEELGRVSEAINCWRAGYAVLHHVQDERL